MPLRAGLVRAQLWVEAASRPVLQAELGPWVESMYEWGEARKVRWSIDVDPQFD